MDLKNKRALVTGGSSGIGLALCMALVEAGAEVLACGSSARRTADFAAAHPEMGAVVCDVSDRAQVRELAAAVDERLGGLDLLIHCAGIQQSLDFTAGVDPRRIACELDVNLLGPMQVTNALLGRLLESREAAIVNVTSVLALAPKQCAPVYCASKAGLAAWTRALRYQLEGQILVTELVPPLVDTPMTAGRNDAAVDPAVVAQACLRGLQRNQQTIAVGKARVGRALHRVAPALLARALRHS